MFKILLKLKKAWKSVLIVVVLLIVQAMGELTLPDYTSKIFNVGIQQGGIESCVPDAIREASMQNILLATDDDDYILDKYTLLSKSNLNSEGIKCLWIIISLNQHGSRSKHILYQNGMMMPNLVFLFIGVFIQCLLMHHIPMS